MVSGAVVESQQKAISSLPFSESTEFNVDHTYKSIFDLVRNGKEVFAKFPEEFAMEEVAIPLQSIGKVFRRSFLNGWSDFNFLFNEVSEIESLVEKLGAESLSSRDEWGYTPAHWAALDGNVEVMRYLVERAAPVDLSCLGTQGPRPIHWACRKGHTTIVQLLLQAGVAVNAADFKGLTPLMTAAMFGRAATAAYLLGMEALNYLTDINGDSALHWAAYKGHPELIKLLMYSGIDLQKADNFGSTPLHLACLSGNVDCVKILCEKSKIELEPRDKNGKTPLMLAKSHRHDDIVKVLVAEYKRRSRWMPPLTEIWGILFGGAGDSKGPLILFIVSVLFWEYPIYILKCVPMTWNLIRGSHYCFIYWNLLMWLAWVIANRRNPGYIPKNSECYFRAIRQDLNLGVAVCIEVWSNQRPVCCLSEDRVLVIPVYGMGLLPVRLLFRLENGIFMSKALANSTRNTASNDGDQFKIPYYDKLKKRDIVLSRLCHSCKCLRPLRAKHCRICNRCVAYFDHHCPFIHNCIGVKNRIWFLLFVLSVAVNCSFAVYFACYCMAMAGFDVLYFIGALESLVFGVLGWILTCTSILHACMNLTTNEMFNYKRYPYLRDKRGKYLNPFSRGPLLNLIEFFVCTPSDSDEQVLLIEDSI